MWWIEHPSAGRRPALVLTRDEAIGVLNKVLVVPTTGTRRGIGTEVPLDVEDGMSRPCVLTLDNMGPLSKSLLIERITVLREDKLRDVCTALAHAVCC